MVPPDTFLPEPPTDPVDAIRERILAAESAAAKAGAVIELDHLRWNADHECYEADALMWDFPDLESLGRAMQAAAAELLRK